MAKGLGLLLPIQRGSIGYFDQGTDLITQVKSNLRNLILTKPGERLMQPGFGCDVHRYIFEPLTDENVANVRSAVQNAVKTWMPFLQLVDLQVEKDEDNHQINCWYTYQISNLATITDTITFRA